MNTQKKPFDCVEMKRAGALKIYEDTKDMSLAEEREYWRRATEETVRAQDDVRRKIRKGPLAG
ncbi:MAG: hypothetical protein FJY92_03105 [Candidatus Hydrogenedentes bacterium]|nr:hypothetical protein [Candidatus Hydrogenedentota bacterium]